MKALVTSSPVKTYEPSNVEQYVGSFNLMNSWCLPLLMHIHDVCGSNGMSLVEEYDEYICIRSPNNRWFISFLHSIVEVENYPGVSLHLVRHQLVNLTCCYLKNIIDQFVTCYCLLSFFILFIWNLKINKKYDSFASTTYIYFCKLMSSVDMTSHLQWQLLSHVSQDKKLSLCSAMLLTTGDKVAGCFLHWLRRA